MQQQELDFTCPPGGSDDVRPLTIGAAERPGLRPVQAARSLLDHIRETERAKLPQAAPRPAVHTPPGGNPKIFEKRLD